MKYETAAPSRPDDVEATAAFNPTPAGAKVSAEITQERPAAQPGRAHRDVAMVLKCPRAPDDLGAIRLLTTHSEIPLEELAADHLHVVRCDDGTMSVQQLGDDLQAIARSTQRRC
jgi:hypothetical protein